MLARQQQSHGRPLPDADVGADLPERFLQLMMYDENRAPIGFIEGSIRGDYVNGTETSPVGFVEGVYVSPAWRRKGVARLGRSRSWPT